MVLPNKPAELSDATIVDFLRRQGTATVGDLVEFTHVTATAVRQRLTRLMEQGLVDRTKIESGGRGRPTHGYRLTRAGIRSAGTNYDSLAVALWDEVRSLRDPDVRQGLLKRIADRLAADYGEQVSGDTPAERMEALARLMGERRLPFVVDASSDSSEGLPVLTALACPYPDLAERDRSVCAMEKMLFANLVGAGLKLSSCRLDGDSCCTFAATSERASTPSSSAECVVG